MEDTKNGSNNMEVASKLSATKFDTTTFASQANNNIQVTPQDNIATAEEGTVQTSVADKRKSFHTHLNDQRAPSRDMLSSYKGKLLKTNVTTGGQSSKVNTQPFNMNNFTIPHGDPEYSFPHSTKAVSTPALQSYYEVVRGVIYEAVHDDNFRGGVFKNEVTRNRPVRNMIFIMQISTQVSVEQRNVLANFNRVWAKAVGETHNHGEEFILDNEFIISSGLEYILGELVDMFDKEKESPLPVPLPDHMRYKDPKTLREESAAAAAAAAAKGNGKGKDSEKLTTATLASLSSGPNKSDLLTNLSAGTNKGDVVVKNAIAEIAKVKGEKLTSKDIDELSDETIDILHKSLSKQNQAAGKPMPLGQAIAENIARLEVMAVNAGPPKDAATAPPIKSHESGKASIKCVKAKVSGKLRKGGKGKDKDPEMMAGNASSSKDQ